MHVLSPCRCIAYADSKMELSHPCRQAHKQRKAPWHVCKLIEFRLKSLRNYQTPSNPYARQFSKDLTCTQEPPPSLQAGTGGLLRGLLRPLLVRAEAAAAAASATAAAAGYRRDRRGANNCGADQSEGHKSSLPAVAVRSCICLPAVALMGHSGPLDYWPDGVMSTDRWAQYCVKHERHWDNIGLGL